MLKMGALARGGFPVEIVVMAAAKPQRQTALWRSERRGREADFFAAQLTMRLGDASVEMTTFWVGENFGNDFG
jgi:hypothetical protein